MALPIDVIAAAKAICDEYEGGVWAGGGVPALAARIGYSPAVLYNKLSEAEDARNRLSVRDVILIWLATARIDHLQALGRTMCCAVFPVPDMSKLSDQALLDLIARVHEEAGEYHGILRHALSDGAIDPAELAALTKQVFDWIGAIVEAHSRVKGLLRG